MSCVFFSLSFIYHWGRYEKREGEGYNSIWTRRVCRGPASLEAWVGVCYTQSTLTFQNFPLSLWVCLFLACSRNSVRVNKINLDHKEYKHVIGRKCAQSNRFGWSVSIVWIFPAMNVSHRAEWEHLATNDQVHCSTFENDQDTHQCVTKACLG